MTVREREAVAPVNDVQAVMGHEKPSTTLNLYTHRSDGRDQRIRDAFADS